MHEDSGHSHSDSGHSHGLSSNTLYYGGSYGDGNGGPHFAYTSSGSTNSDKANIQSSKANIGNPTSGKHGEETRPTNMAIVWIMRIY